MNENEPLTAWGEPFPEGCRDEAGAIIPEAVEHLGYSDYDGECRDCGVAGFAPQDCGSCQ